MTVNAYIFMWSCEGIESIIPISRYEHWDQEQLINMLREEPVKPNPLNNIVNTLIMRAKFNTQRHYEIYVVDCHSDLTEEFWHQQWQEHPQFTADLIRDRGIKLYSDRYLKQAVIV